VSAVLLAARAYEALARGKSAAERERLAREVLAVLLSAPASTDPASTDPEEFPR
jgi:hypothetical protein